MAEARYQTLPPTTFIIMHSLLNAHAYAVVSLSMLRQKLTKQSTVGAKFHFRTRFCFSC